MAAHGKDGVQLGNDGAQLSRADIQALARARALAAAGAEEELDVAPIEVLSALARLDAEAAHAYRAAESAIGASAIAERLGAFADDHLRHVADLRRIVEAIGETSLRMRIDPGGMLLPALVRVAAPLGPETVLAALFNAEQLTNLTYEDALAFEWDDAAERILEQNRADEQRHFDWLAAALRGIGEAEEQGPDGSQVGEPH